MSMPASSCALRASRVASRLATSSSAPEYRHGAHSLFGSASQNGFGRLPAMVVGNIVSSRRSGAFSGKASPDVIQGGNRFPKENGTKYELLDRFSDFSNRIRSSRLLKKFVWRLFFSMVSRLRRALIGAEWRSGSGMSGGLGSWSDLQADSSCGGQDFRDANEIVGGRRQDEEPFHQTTPAVAGLAQAADGLHPPERLLDPLTLDGADAVAGMSGRAPIDRRAAVAIVLGDVRRAAAFATACDEVGRVVVLVGPHRAARLGIVRDHVERGRALGRAI